MTIINQCTLSFKELVDKQLPAYLNVLEQSVANPTVSASYITKKGTGVKTFLTRIEKEEDFPGCYVFIEAGKPIYVGISGNVVQRLFQHLKTKSHFSASLSYLMAKQEYNPGKTRAKNMEDQKFKNIFTKAQKRLSLCKIAFIEINNSLELHLFEVYASMSFKTGKYNTFETH